MAKKPIETEALLHEVIAKLRECMASIELRGDGEHPATVGNLARISTALISAAAEMRQHEKRRADAVSSIPLDQIVAYLRTLPDVKRRDVCRDVLGSDDELPLLM